MSQSDSIPQTGPRITPQWSHDLTTAAHSPLFTPDLQGMRQREAFLDQAEKYASADDLPLRLKEVYRRAMAAYDETDETDTSSE